MSRNRRHGEMVAAHSGQKAFILLSQQMSLPRKRRFAGLLLVPLIVVADMVGHPAEAEGAGLLHQVW